MPPFDTKTFLLTRDPDGNRDVAVLIEQRGGRVIDWPCFTYCARSDDSVLSKTLEQACMVDWFIFTSARSVEFFFEKYFAVHRDMEPMAHVNIAVVGGVTERKLANMGLKTTLVAKPNTVEGLAHSQVFFEKQGLRILMPCAADAGDEFQQVHGQRHSVERLVVYEKKACRPEKAAVTLLTNQHIDWCLFFSPSAVQYFVAGLGKNSARSLLDKTQIAVIGPTTAKALLENGFTAKVVASQASARVLLAEIEAAG